MECVSECEEKVLMAVYGSTKPPRMKDVLVDVNHRVGRDWMPQTVSVFLARLVRKGYLRAEKRGRNTYYYPLVSLAEYQEMKLKRMKEELFDGDAELLGKYLNEL